MLTVEELLTKYDISPERYMREKSALMQKGYSETQCNKLILNEDTALKIERLHGVHDVLMEFGFERDGIVRVAATKNGDKHIAALVEVAAYNAARGHPSVDTGSFLSAPPRKCALPTAFVFSPGQLERIAAYDGCTKILLEIRDTALANFEREFYGLEYTVEEITRLLSTPCGYKNLETLREYFTQFELFNFDAKTATALIHSGNIELVLQILNKAKGLELYESHPRFFLQLLELPQYCVKKADTRKHMERLKLPEFCIEELDRMQKEQAIAETAKQRPKRPSGFEGDAPSYNGKAGRFFEEPFSENDDEEDIPLPSPGAGKD